MAKIKKRRRRLRTDGPCPCGTGNKYTVCCQPYVLGESAPETAELLMRSRYSAYAMAKANYIIETTDPDGSAWEDDADIWRRRILKFSRGSQYAGVVILEHEEDGDESWVKFRAIMTAERKDASFTERSYFRRVDGRWLYHSGEMQ